MSAIVSTNPCATERCPRCGAGPESIFITSVELEETDPLVSYFKHFVDLHGCKKCKFTWAENEACYTTSQVAQFLINSFVSQVKEELSNRVQTQVWFDEVTKLLKKEKVLPATYAFDKAKGYAENYLDLLIKVNDFITSSSREELLDLYQAWAIYMEEPPEIVPDVDSLSDPATIEKVLIDD